MGRGFSASHSSGRMSSPTVISYIFIVPKLGYFGVMICEPLIWIVMTGQLAWAFYGNGYIREKNWNNKKTGHC